MSNANFSSHRNHSFLFRFVRSLYTHAYNVWKLRRKQINKQLQNGRVLCTMVVSFRLPQTDTRSFSFGKSSLCVFLTQIRHATELESDFVIVFCFKIVFPYVFKDVIERVR
jgi:hypothetical protein